MGEDSSNLKNEKKLGRGIASLLTIDDDFSFGNNFIKNEDIGNINDSTIHLLNVNDVVPNPNQPRKIFNNAKLKELSESIKNNGLLQPILVSKIKDGVNKGKYIIIAGERRYRASKIAGLKEIKAIVLDLNQQEMLKNAILENIQRENLNPVEEAFGYKKIIEAFGYTHDQLAKAIGKSRAHVTNLLRILNLPEEVRSAIENENITLGHAKVLMGIENPEDYLSTIIEKQLSIRQLEKLIADNEAGNNETTGTIKENSDINDDNNNGVANITFEMIKQLYSPLANTSMQYNNDDVKSEHHENRNLNIANKEWKQIEENIKIIEKQLSESCGFNIRLLLKKDGSGKFEISFNDSNELLDLVKFFQ